MNTCSHPALCPVPLSKVELGGEFTSGIRGIVLFSPKQQLNTNWNPLYTYMIDENKLLETVFPFRNLGDTRIAWKRSGGEACASWQDM